MMLVLVLINRSDGRIDVESRPASSCPEGLSVLLKSSTDGQLAFLKTPDVPVQEGEEGEDPATQRLQCESPCGIVRIAQPMQRRLTCDSLERCPQVSFEGPPVPG